MSWFSDYLAKWRPMTPEEEAAAREAVAGQTIELGAPSWISPAGLAGGAKVLSGALSVAQKVGDMPIPLGLAGAKTAGSKIKHLFHKKGKQAKKQSLHGAAASAHATKQGGRLRGMIAGGKALFGGGGGMDLGGMTGGKMRGFGGHHRRMRATNPKALRRAIRRVYAAEKIYRKLFSVTHRHQPGHIHARKPHRRHAA